MAGTKSTTTLDRRQSLQMIERFFQTLQKCCTQKEPIQASALEPFLSKNFQLTSNERVLARSLNDYLARLTNFQKKFSNFEITGPSSEPVMEGNRLVVPYSIDCTTKDGERHEVLIIGIGTIEDNKIKAWHQITHEKGAKIHWDT